MPAVASRNRTRALSPDIPLALLAAIAILIAATPCASFADGIYIPEIAHPALPKVPRQTALIVQHGTTQTWIIESPLDAQAQSLGWIIPVPAVPDKIEKASPGILRTLENITRPTVVFSRHDFVLPFLLTFVAVLPVTLLSVQLASTRIGVIVAIAGSVALAIFFAFFLLPAFGESGPQTLGCTAYPIDPSTDEIAPVATTSYQSTVLSPKSIEDIDEWLSTRGLCPVPSQYRSPLKACIARKWSFVATHLTRSALGLNTPPPIRITFEHPRPVLPAEISQDRNTRPLRTVFLITDEPCSIRGFRVSFCDRFYAFLLGDFRDRYFFPWLDHNLRMNACLPEIAYLAHHNDLDKWIVQPELATIAWDCCVLTRFLSSPMDSVFSPDITLKPSAPLQDASTVFSQSGAIDMILTWGIAALWCTLLSVAVLERSRKPMHRSVRRWFVRSLLACGTLIPLGLCTYVLLPVVPVSVRHLPRERAYWHWMPRILSDAALAVAQPSPQELATAIRAELGKSKSWQHPARLSDDGGPGDISVIQHDGRPVIRFHDHNGLPIDIPVHRSPPSFEPTPP